MTTYINKRQRVFRRPGEDDDDKTRKRSPGRMKNIQSSTDNRAWCTDDESRRQYILELLKSKPRQSLSLGKYIPIDVLIDLLLANKNADIERLQKKVEELQALLDMYNNLDLTDEQKKSIKKMRADMRATSDGLSSYFDLLSDGSTRSSDVEMLTPRGADEFETDSEGVDGFRDGPGGRGGRDGRGGAQSYVSGEEDCAIITYEGPGRRRTCSSGGMSGAGSGGRSPYGQTGSGGQTPYGQTGSGGQTPYGQTGSGGQTPYGQPGSGGQTPYGQPGSGGQTPYGQPGSGAQTPYGQPGSGGQTPYGQDGSGAQTPYGQSGSGAQTPRTCAAGGGGIVKKAERPGGQPEMVVEIDLQGPAHIEIEAVAVQAPVQQPTVQQPTYMPTPPIQQPTYMPTPTVQQPTYMPTPAVQQPTYGPTPTDKPPSPTRTRSCSPVCTGGSKKEITDIRASIEAIRKVSIRSTPTIDFDNLNPAALKKLLMERDNELATLRNQAKDAADKLGQIQKIINENEELKKKLQKAELQLAAMQKEKSQLAKAVVFAEKGSDVVALESEIKQIRNVGELNPDEETELIKKELDVLKAYCEKLSNIQSENEELKRENDHLKRQLLKKSNRLPEDDKEEVMEVKQLEKKLNKSAEQIRTLESKLTSARAEVLKSDEIKSLKQRSAMLDDVLDERDNLQNRLHYMGDLEQNLCICKRRAEEADHLQREKNDLLAEIGELQKFRRQADYQKGDIEALKAEKEKMNQQLQCVKKERDDLKCRMGCIEGIEQERDMLRQKCGELDRMKEEIERLRYQAKQANILKLELDRLQSRIDELSELEVEVATLVDQLHNVSIERDVLRRQVCDSECIIADQEDEIKTLICHVDRLSRGVDSQQEQINTALNEMRNELSRKTLMLASSQDRIKQLDSIKSEMIKVEGELRQTIEHLNLELKSKQGEIEKLECKLGCNFAKSSFDLVNKMSCALRCAQEENERLQYLIGNLQNVCEHDHIGNMLAESKQAIHCVISEVKDYFQKKELCMTQDEPYLADENQQLRRFSVDMQNAAHCRINEVEQQLRECLCQNAELRAQNDMFKSKTPELDVGTEEMSPCQRAMMQKMKGDLEVEKAIRRATEEESSILKSQLKEKTEVIEILSAEIAEIPAQTMELLSSVSCQFRDENAQLKAESAMLKGELVRLEREIEGGDISPRKAVSDRSRAVSIKEDAVSDKSKPVSIKEDAVSDKSRAVSVKGDAVSDKSRTVSVKEDAVSDKSRAVSVKEDAVSDKSKQASIKEDAVSVKSKQGSIKEDAVSVKSKQGSIKEDAVSVKSEALSLKQDTAAPGMAEEEFIKKVIFDETSPQAGDDKKVKTEETSLQAEFDRCQAENERLKVELFQYKAGLAEEGEVDKLKRQVKEYSKSLEDVSGDGDQLKQTILELKRLVEGLECENKCVRDNLEDLCCENNCLRTCLMSQSPLEENVAVLELELKGQNTRLEQELSELKEEIECMRTCGANQGGGDAELEKCKKKNASLESRIKELEETLKYVQKEKNDVNDMLDANVRRSSRQEIDNNDEIDRLKHKVGKLKRSNEELEKIASLAGVPSCDTGKINELENYIKQIENERNDLEARLAKMRKEQNELMDKFEQNIRSGSAHETGLETEIQKLQAKIAEQEETIIKLQKTIESMKGQIADQSDLKDIEAKLKECQDAKANAESRLAHMTKEQNELRDKLETHLRKNSVEEAQLQGDLLKTKSRLKDLEGANADLEKQLAAAKLKSGEGADKIGALQKEAESLASKLKASQQEKADLDSKLAGLQKTLDSANKDKAAVQAELDKLKKEMEDLLKKLQMDADNEAKLKKEKQALNDMIKKLEEQLKELDVLQSEISSLKKDKDANAKLLEKERAEKAALLEKERAEKAASQKKAAEIDGLQKDVDSLKAERDSFKNQLSKEKSEKDALNNAMKNLEAELKRLKDQLNDKTKECESLKASVDKLKAESNDLVKKLEGVSNELKNKAAEADKLKTELTETNNKKESEKSSMNAENDRLKREMADLLNKLQAAKIDDAALAKEKADKSKLNDIIKQLESQLAALGAKSADTDDKYKKLLKEKEAAELALEMAKKRYFEEMKQMRGKQGESLNKLQTLHEEASHDMVRNYEKEIDALQKQLAECLGKACPCGTKAKLKQIIPTFGGICPCGKPIDSNLTRACSIVTDVAPSCKQATLIEDEKPVSMSKSLDNILTKAMKNGIENLTYEELSNLYTKICNAAKAMGRSFEPSIPCLDPPCDKLTLMRKIAKLEEDLTKRQRAATDKVKTLEMSMQMEKQRLEEVRSALAVERRRNNDLTQRVCYQTREVANIEVERDLLKRQSSYHEDKLQTLIVAVEEERSKIRTMEDDLQKEKITAKHLRTMLENEKERAKSTKCKANETIEMMRLRLERALDSESELRTQIQSASIEDTGRLRICCPREDASSSPRRRGDASPRNRELGPSTSGPASDKRCGCKKSQKK